MGHVGYVSFVRVTLCHIYGHLSQTGINTEVQLTCLNKSPGRRSKLVKYIVIEGPFHIMCNICT